jgi:hypothetical protein
MFCDAGCARVRDCDDTSGVVDATNSSEKGDRKREVR